MRIINVVGARPNFMKIAPIIEAIRSRSEADQSLGRNHTDQILVHTGQHYDQHMSRLFFDELGIPQPDVNLEVGSGTHAAQTAEIMKRFEPVCLDKKPSHVLVVGDVNSTIACALVASKLGIKVIHVEAGLRSFDRSMPEEINRILTDAISDILFTTEESANENLRREGIPQEKIHFVGNVMIDTLLQHRERAEESPILKKLGLKTDGDKVNPYGVLTLHRPATVDDPNVFNEIISALLMLSQDLPIMFPVHPRTREKINSFKMHDMLQWLPFQNGSAGVPNTGIYATEPLGYLDFLGLMSNAKLVLTDSGGIQEETTILGVPCVTLRETTERPITLTRGTNVLAGIKMKDIVSKAFDCLYDGKNGHEPDRGSPAGLHPPLWDGKAAQRIAEVLAVIE